jgi:hypothetical protein
MARRSREEVLQDIYEAGLAERAARELNRNEMRRLDEQMDAMDAAAKRAAFERSARDLAEAEKNRFDGGVEAGSKAAVARIAATTKATQDLLRTQQAAAQVMESIQTRALAGSQVGIRDRLGALRDSSEGEAAALALTGKARAAGLTRWLKEAAAGSESKNSGANWLAGFLHARPDLCRPHGAPGCATDAWSQIGDESSPALVGSPGPQLADRYQATRLAVADPTGESRATRPRTGAFRALASDAASRALAEFAARDDRAWYGLLPGAGSRLTALEDGVPRAQVLRDLGPAVAPVASAERPRDAAAALLQAWARTDMQATVGRTSEAAAAAARQAVNARGSDDPIGLKAERLKPLVELVGAPRVVGAAPVDGRIEQARSAAVDMLLKSVDCARVTGPDPIQMLDWRGDARASAGSVAPWANSFEQVSGQNGIGGRWGLDAKQQWGASGRGQEVALLDRLVRLVEEIKSIAEKQLEVLERLESVARAQAASERTVRHSVPPPAMGAASPDWPTRI